VEVVDKVTAEEAALPNELTIEKIQQEHGITELFVDLLEPQLSLRNGDVRVRGETGGQVVSWLDQGHLGMQIEEIQRNAHLIAEGPQVLLVDGRPRSQNEAALPGMPPVEGAVL
jgi:hypothetical protein